MKTKIILLFLFLPLIKGFSQDNEGNYQKLRDSLQTLPNYDTVSFFNIIHKLNVSSM